MADAARRITPVTLTGETWAPFGWLPVADTDPRDGASVLDFAWHDVHVNRIGHRRDEVPAVAGGLRCQTLFRHVTHTQVVMPLDVPAVVVVAPPAVEITTPDDLDQVRAFCSRSCRRSCCTGGHGTGDRIRSVPIRWSCSTSKDCGTARTTKASTSRRSVRPWTF